jgi:hypothetical protein
LLARSARQRYDAQIAATDEETRGDFFNIVQQEKAMAAQRLMFLSMVLVLTFALCSPSLANKKSLNQKPTLKSNVHKKADDTAAGQQQKIGMKAPTTPKRGTATTGQAKARR